MCQFTLGSGRFRVDLRECGSKPLQHARNQCFGASVHRAPRPAGGLVMPMLEHKFGFCQCSENMSRVPSSRGVVSIRGGGGGQNTEISESTCELREARKRTNALNRAFASCVIRNLRSYLCSGKASLCTVLQLLTRSFLRLLVLLFLFRSLSSVETAFCPNRQSERKFWGLFRCF